MKRIKLIVTFFIFISFMQGYIFSHTNKRSDTVLASIEALDSDKLLWDSAEKNETTWQDGPYIDMENAKLYYWVYTLTECYGIGTVKCSWGLTSDIVYQ